MLPSLQTSSRVGPLDFSTAKPWTASSKGWTVAHETGDAAAASPSGAAKASRLVEH